VNVLFVNYHDFRSNSAVHIANLANRLATVGWSCAVAVPSKQRTAKMFHTRRFAAVDYKGARRSRFGFPASGGPDLIHAWTPREGVRRITSELAERFHVPFLVHLEDNEEVIAADQLGIARDRLHSAPETEIQSRMTATISHPRRSRELLSAAAGITLIVDRLAELAPLGIPTLVLPPAYEAELFFPQPDSDRLRRKLGLGPHEHVLVYAGNVHPTNAGEVRDLYLAIAELQRRRLPTRLVRLGQDFVDFLGGCELDRRSLEIRVPFQPRERLASLYALADVLVQPGRPGDIFNEFRIPSKLPEFFAMGLPVILPRANVGRVAKDGEECLLLETGDPEDIADKVERVVRDERLGQQLSEGARAFAERTFSWERSARALNTFYETTLARK
jgi:glycosyltransferase involved in cell wall biosynthesis